MNDTTIEQLQWIIPGLATAAGLEHPDADASHLLPWAFPNPHQSMAYHDLDRA